MRLAGKTLLALLMGLLVANPVCCCTLAKFATTSQPGESRSCCGGGDSGTRDTDQTPSHDCPCAKNHSAIVEHKAPGIIPQFSPEFHVDQLSVAAALLPARPGPCSLAFPLDLPPPPAAWRLNCRYLL